MLDSNEHESSQSFNLNGKAFVRHYRHVLDRFEIPHNRKCNCNDAKPVAIVSDKGMDSQVEEDQFNLREIQTLEDRKVLDTTLFNYLVYVTKDLKNWN